MSVANIYDQVLSRGVNAERLSESGLANPQQWLVDWVRGGKETDAGVPVSETTAMSCTAVKACVGIRAETLARLPLRVFEDLGDGKKRLAREHWADHLLHREPNSETAQFNWMEVLQSHVDLWGNAYAEIEWNKMGSRAMGLWQRSPKPEHTKPKRADDKRLVYEARDEHGYPEGDIAAKDMLHIAGLGFNGLHGYSVITDAKQTVGLARGREKYAAQFYGRDCRPGGVITVAGELKEDAYKRTKRAFNENDERHRIQLLEGGATFAATQMNPVDVQLVDAQRLSVEDIARIYRVPLPLVQLYISGMAYASVVELNRAFIQHTIAPIGARWKSELNRKLVRPPFFCEFNYNDFLKGDAKARGEFYRTQFSFGGLTINDFLRMEDRNPIGSEGDRRFVPMNMMPLDRVDEYVDALIEGKRAKKTALAPRGQAAVLALFGSLMERMLARQAKAAKQAANKPDTFLRWLDDYYEGEPAMLISTLESAVEMLDSLGIDIEGGVVGLVSRHVEESRQRLLRVSECLPNELAERLAAEVDTWSVTRKHEGLPDE